MTSVISILVEGNLFVIVWALVGKERKVVIVRAKMRDRSPGQLAKDKLAFYPITSIHYCIIVLLISLQNLNLNTNTFAQTVRGIKSECHKEFVFYDICTGHWIYHVIKKYIENKK